MYGLKSNHFINNLHKTNDRMIKILGALRLEASSEVSNVPQKLRAQLKIYYDSKLICLLIYCN